eukprot:SAG11_NODE_1991_length_3957_cov_2.906169_2_plen_163_part_00
MLFELAIQCCSPTLAIIFVVPGVATRAATICLLVQKARGKAADVINRTCIARAHQSKDKAGGQHSVSIHAFGLDQVVVAVFGHAAKAQDGWLTAGMAKREVEQTRLRHAVRAAVHDVTGNIDDHRKPDIPHNRVNFSATQSGRANFITLRVIFVADYKTVTL